MCQACSEPFTSINSFCPHSTTEKLRHFSYPHFTGEKGETQEQSGNDSKDLAELGFGLEETCSLFS